MPAFVWMADVRGLQPAIVTLHGGGHDKSVVGPATASRVVSAGVTLVSVDLYLHGEHFDDAASSLDVGYETLLEIVAHTAHDLEGVVADLDRDPAIKRGAIAVRGESLGAYAALTALGLGVPFCLGLSVGGAADYELTMAHALGAAGSPAGMIRDEQNRLRVRIREFDPLSRAEEIAPRPIMMVHGLFDEAVPIEADRGLYAALATHYASSPDDCLFLTHAGGHNAPAAVDDLAWEWLIRRLVAF
ncbi:MAG: alpha/beta hydrolase family protein [Gaiellaceae bacterium]